MLIALTRSVPASINRCELTHVERAPIDLARAERQHELYERALGLAGCMVRRIRPEPDLPDSVFVEDAAVVFDGVAVIARPGAPSRRPETASVAAALSPFRRLEAISEPATLDGGDVLVIGTEVFVGVGGRTNVEGVAELERLVAPSGYRVRAVEVTGCLHLKSAATRVAEGVVLVNPAWVDPAVFGPLERIEIDPAEPFAANALQVGRTLLHGAGYPRTSERLERRGIPVTAVDLSELAKAEGALTCCSLVFESAVPPGP
jgi:dimethylargininase